MIPELKENQSVELLKELGILTRDGKINQDSRRKLKQIYHIYQFLEKDLESLYLKNQNLNLVDHGAGKSYLGFILYDLFFKTKENSHVYGVEFRSELVKKSIELQNKFKFKNMTFVQSSIDSANENNIIKGPVHIVTALHACDTATDDTIKYGLSKKADVIFVIPCCQAEVASYLRANKKYSLKNPLVEIYRNSLHTREFGSHLTNVLRVLLLESHGYDVTVTELIGLEHSMKNELIIARKNENHKGIHLATQEKIQHLLKEFKIQELESRFCYELPKAETHNK